jgi:hypothetical protein
MRPEQNKYIFDVPIYWCEEELFWRNYDMGLAKHLDSFEQQTGYPLTTDLKNSLTDSFWRDYIAPWKFNQTVGWIRIYKSGTQLRGDFWYMNAKRAGRKLTKKQFSEKGKAFELPVLKSATSQQIYEELRTELLQMERKKRPKSTAVPTFE